MLADVTAMANAQGGYILIGVEEDTTQPDGTPKQLIGIENGDSEGTWIESVCLSSIDEKIAGLRVRDIVLSNGRSCVIIQVPNSIRKPHMVVHEKHRSFRIRHERAKSFMGMGGVPELRV
jgi:predicted HTH transcriptional regulator